MNRPARGAGRFMHCVVEYLLNRAGNQSFSGNADSGGFPLPRKRRCTANDTRLL